MATTEFKIDEARAFWRVSSELRRALRDDALPPDVIGALTAELKNHARYGIQPGIRVRANLLLAQAQLAVRTG